AEWNVTADNVGAAVEMAACLVAAGKAPEALAALAKIGTNFADASRVRAVELAGDLYMRTAAYGDAVTAYGYGVQYVDAALGREVGRDEAGNYARELSEADKALRERLQRKLWQAEARRDAERYGPDWRLYKEATAAEWQERDYAKAYVRYQKLIADHPETVYAEAARCYRLKALFQLAAVSDKDAARAAAGREWALKQAQKLAQAAQRAKVARPVLRALQKRLDEAKAELQELRSVPHGEKAEKLAFKELEKFLKDNELGLYRGEALLAAGDYLLETRLTVEGAGRHYERALAWLDKAEGADAALKDFALPGRSAAVARPPAAERKIVRFGDYENNVKETVAPGAVVNRLTAPWYAPKLRRDALIHLGLLAYAQGKYEAAAATWDKIAGLDPS
ncbi:MAG: hypothetical protein J6333_07170, partial [Planctomycetes bacterium]|nr:hypothetical protein [Planctomycetota bacterium]